MRQCDKAKRTVLHGRGGEYVILIVRTAVGVCATGMTGLEVAVTQVQYSWYKVILGKGNCSIVACLLPVSDKHHHDSGGGIASPVAARNGGGYYCGGPSTCCHGN